MVIVRGLVKVFDWLSEWIGRAVSWVGVFIMLTMTFEVIMRYVFNRATAWSYDITIMMGGVLFLLSTPYVLLYRGNVRVDIFYARFAPKVKALIDVVFTMFYLFGAVFVFTQQSWVFARMSFLQREISQFGYWEPSMVPFRFLIAIGFTLLTLQMLSTFAKDLYLLVKGKALIESKEGSRP